MSNLSIMTIGGVECYEKDGVAYLKLETVARGLGFTQTQKKNGAEYTSIRWETVRRYLAGFGFPSEMGKDDFIPENVFYRLAMKAKNEAAEKFQALVADEIIPSIRKTGGYQMQAPQMTQLEVLAATAQALVEQERRVKALETSVNEIDKKLDGVADALTTPKTTEAEKWQRETHKAITSFCQENKLSYRDFYDELYAKLEEQAHVNLSSRVTRRQNRARFQGASWTEISRISKLFMVSIDPKLRLIFDGLVKDFKIAYKLRA